MLSLQVTVEVLVLLPFITGAFNEAADGATFINSETKLLSKLLTNYSTLAMPVKSYGDALTVYFRLLLLNIHELDESTRTFKTEVFYRQNWTDFQLTWNPDEYDGIKTVRIPTDKIWMPDIVLHNSVATLSQIVNTLAVVHYTGLVEWTPHAHLRSFCSLDYAFFPFDVQRCDLLFGSWTYEKARLDIRTHSNDTDPFQLVEFVNDGKEWNVEHIEVMHEDFSYMLGYTYPYIRYSFVMRRESIFYRHFFVVPAVLLAFLTLYIFFIPPESGERITLAVGILLSDILLMALLERHIPTDVGIVTTIGKYYTYLLVMIMFVTLESVFQLNCYHRQAVDGIVPKWMKTCCLGRLSTIMCVEKVSYTSIPMGQPAADVFSELHYVANDDQAQILNNSADSLNSVLRGNTVEETLKDIRKYLKICSDQMTGLAPKELTHAQLILKEWRRIAVVFDRLAFWIFTVITFFVTIALCMK